MADAGNSTEISRRYFDSLYVEMRHIDSVLPDTRMRLYGEMFETPIMTAAFSHLNPFHENGMVEMAKGAAACGAVNWAGMGDERELDDLCATGAKVIKIIKPYADREKIYKKLEHAKKAGALAVGMDVDHQFGGDGNYGVVVGEPMHPVTSAELRDFVRAAGLPFIVKGVLSVEDAEKCVEAGVRGAVVSHHHGMLPYAVPPLMALPRIAAAVGSKLDLFVDCAVATGADAFKALALGAKGVCVGRAMLPALKEDGAQGVERYLRQATAELKAFMARTGSKDVESIDPSLIWRQA